MNYSDFINSIRNAGVVGQGGAGFPTHVKYAANVDTVIVNGCECEPLLATDNRLMTSRPEALLHTAAEVAAGVGASRCVLAVKGKNKASVEALRAVPDCGVELHLVDDFYPAGDEQTLVRVITGKCVPPLGIPAKCGVLVTNVGTLLAAHDAKEGTPVAWKTVTVTGEVAMPGVIDVPTGTPISECIKACGGIRIADPVCILGGPLMGKVVESFENEVVTKTLGGIILLPKGHPLHLNARQKITHMRKAALSACIQCRFCTDMCPRFLNGQPFETHRVMRAFAAGVELESPAALQAFLCCECGVCELMACPMGLSPRRINIALKNSLRAAGLQYAPTCNTTGEPLSPRSVAFYRQTPSKRLAVRLGLAKYLSIKPEYLKSALPDLIRLPLRQHIGVPAVPLVSVGDRVAAGDVVADIPEGALGARIHTGITGEVVLVDASIHIRRTGS